MKPILIIRSGFNWPDKDKVKLDLDIPDWHILVVSEDRENLAFEAYGIDLDEITIKELKKKLYIK